jgi:tRNA threonylcarbamoyladenosine biosynthesis protein TsaE
LAQALCTTPSQQRWMIYLQGNLGVGKTTFSRGLLQALGHTGSVKSPTYTLVEPYDVAAGKIYHFDLYRLRDPQELEYIGAQEYFEHAFLCLVEWPECGRGFLPEADLILELNPQSSGRSLSIKAQTTAGEQLLKKFSLPEK